MSDRNARIVELHVTEGLNLSQIAIQYGITRERVRQIVKKYHGETLTWKRFADDRAARKLARVRAAAEKRAYRRSLAYIRDRSSVNENGCWIWQRALYPTGYGSTTISMGGGYAHRHAWEVANGPIPDETPRLIVCHRCDVPSCVNPEHLFLGTHSDNHWDAVLKGRKSNTPGHRHPVTHCIHGHEFTPENTYTNRGSRQCRACGRIRCAEYHARKRLAAPLNPVSKPGFSAAGLSGAAPHALPEPPRGPAQQLSLEAA